MESFTIAHLSDIHCGGGYFVPDLMERAIADINALDPDIVVCSGDLTTMGFKEEYAQAKRYLDRIACESFVVVPGNHDSRNVGYVHFEDLFGARNSVLRKGPVTVVAVDSTATPNALLRPSRRREQRCPQPEAYRRPQALAISTGSRFF